MQARRRPPFQVLLLLAIPVTLALLGVGIAGLLEARSAADAGLVADRHATAARVGRALTSELTRCRTRIRDEGQDPITAGCSGLEADDSPFHWFVRPLPRLGEHTSSSLDLVVQRKRLTHRIEHSCVDGALEHCAALASDLADSPRHTNQLVAYHGVGVLALLENAGAFEMEARRLRRRLEEIVVDETLGTHRRQLAEFLESAPADPDGLLPLRLGRYAIDEVTTPEVEQFLLADLTPQSEAVERFVQARSLAPDGQYRFSVSAERPEGGPHQEILEIDPRVGFLVVDDASYEERLVHVRRSNTWLLVWFCLGGAFLIGAFLLAYRTASAALRVAEMKETFVASVSHEFRSPLGALRLMLETLQAGRVATPEQREYYYGRMMSETERLIRLSENVLTAGKLQHHQRLERVACSPRELLKPVLESLETHASRREVHIECRYEGQGRALVDPDLAQTALVNVIENALKFSEAGTAVEVVVSSSADSISFSIRDEGPGIPPSEQERIFEWFHQAPSQSRGPGVGLGLALVHRIVDLHGGSVRLNSGEQGTEVELSFPMEREDAS